MHVGSSPVAMHQIKVLWFYSIHWWGYPYREDWAWGVISGVESSQGRAFLCKPYTTRTPRSLVFTTTSSREFCSSQIHSDRLSYIPMLITTTGSKNQTQMLPLGTATAKRENMDRWLAVITVTVPISGSTLFVWTWKSSQRENLVLSRLSQAW